MSRNLGRLGNQISVPLKADSDGYLGRECPSCEEYFKITPGTGITEGNPPCHCPYCGHSASQDHFFTKAQIEYAKSVAMKKMTNAFMKDLKGLEFDIKPKGNFGIGMSMKVSGTNNVRIRRYAEQTLEEEVICDECTLRYTIYGSFAFCPDCAQHNSFQILKKNIDLAKRMISLGDDVEGDLAKQLVDDALENGVSAFDGFGRETCTVHKSKAVDPDKAEKVSFQNLARAQQRVKKQFNVDLADAIDADEWDLLKQCFQKRHLLAHKMGIVDEAYLNSTNDSNARIGRKISILPNDVSQMLELLTSLGGFVSKELDSLP